MRAAAWPAGARCDAPHHDALCARLAAGLPVGDGASASAAGLTTSVPLAAIPSAVWLGGAGADAGEREGDDSSDAASVTASSVGSSWASTTSGGSDGGAPWCTAGADPDSNAHGHPYSLLGFKGCLSFVSP